MKSYIFSSFYMKDCTINSKKLFFLLAIIGRSLAIIVLVVLFQFSDQKNIFIIRNFLFKGYKKKGTYIDKGRCIRSSIKKLDFLRTWNERFNKFAEVKHYKFFLNNKLRKMLYRQLLYWYKIHRLEFMWYVYRQCNALST